MTPVRPLVLLRSSVALTQRHPFHIWAIGFALVLSQSAVCCGLGLVATPWLGCELVASLLGAADGVRPARARGWILAGSFLLVATLLLSLVGWLAVAIGAPADRAPLLFTDVGPPTAGAVVLAGGLLLAFAFITPFLYAPFILVDRGGDLVSACLESARLVAEDGAASHYLLMLCSHLVQWSPLVVGAGVVLVFDHSAVLAGVALAVVPALAFTVPLGQGMLAAAWLDRRARHVLNAGRSTPRALSASLALLVVLPVVALVVVGAVVVRPSAPIAATAPAGERLGVVAPGETLDLADSALSLRATSRTVHVLTPDGGGAGEIPPPAPRLDQLVVVRVRDHYALVLRSGNETHVTWIDRAGVRLDDTTVRRLIAHVPAWGILIAVLVLLMTPLLLLVAAPGLVRPPSEAPRANARAWWVVVALMPGTLAMLAAALLAWW